MQTNIQNNLLSHAQSHAQNLTQYKTLVGAVLVAFTLAGCATMTES